MRRLLTVIILSGLCVMMQGAGAGAEASGSATLLWGFAIEGCPVTEARLKKLQADTGIQPDIIVFFLQWPKPGPVPKDAFPRASLEAIWNQGAVPCVTWEPMFLEQGRGIAVSYRQILEGRYDRYLVTFARGARDWGKPFMIRLAHEMNLRRYHWGTDAAGFGPESPGIYRKIFRHVVKIFRDEGATNVRWVFCPNAESVPRPSGTGTNAWNRAGNYYPGDDFVDILGMDGYNWGTTQTKAKQGWDSSWLGFDRIFGELHAELKALAPGKPIMVFETACAGRGGDPDRWTSGLLDQARRWRLRGVCWFQVDKEQDWRLRGTSVARVVKALKPKQERKTRKWLETIKP